MLTERLFRTDGLPSADRFDCWRDHVSQTYTAEIESDHALDFAASQRILVLGGVRLWTVEHPSMTLRRTQKLIRQSDPGLYHLSLPLAGAMSHSGPDREADYEPYDLVLHDTSRPHLMRAITSQGEDTVSGTGLFVPRKLLPLPESAIDGLLMQRLSGREGVGALLAQFLTQVARDSGSYRPDDGSRLGTVAVDLLSAVLAHVLDADRSLPPETHRQALVLRIRAFVQQHLHDPQLTPCTIAAAHHISRSYLYRLFEREEESIAAWIRGQRLEHARRDLAQPAMRTTPIHAIAARWCFTHAADFTRAFRRAYGMSPREYRSFAHRP
ncbi:helix-turn-helix domain-containing protein [Streptomyces angustmyceticus]|uniref:helix-turn-helix domain-containing protein n=1 Tax=Streptomyces angustmyceticus TaxID=285578 RepID=UPI0038309FC7